MATQFADEGYHKAHTTVHFNGEAGQRSAVVHIGPKALSDVFKVGNPEIAQISSATVTKYEASPSIKGKSTSLNFHDGDNNELSAAEQGGYIVTDDRVQEVHVNLQNVGNGNTAVHTFEGATRPIAEIQAERDTGIAKTKYNLDHKPTTGVKVLSHFLLSPSTPFRRFAQRKGVVPKFLTPRRGIAPPGSSSPCFLPPAVFSPPFGKNTRAVIPPLHPL